VINGFNVTVWISIFQYDKPITLAPHYSRGHQTSPQCLALIAGGIHFLHNQIEVNVSHLKPKWPCHKKCICYAHAQLQNNLLYLNEKITSRLKHEEKLGKYHLHYLNTTNRWFIPLIPINCINWFMFSEKHVS
jgi:hypothetical protein